MSDDPLRAAVLALLGKRPSLVLRRQLAERLRALADEQDRLIGAEQRNAAAGGKLAPRSSGGGRPRGTGATFIRVEPRASGYGAFIFIGRALWQQLGEPKRLDIQRAGGVLTFRPCGDGVGYRFTSGVSGMPKCSMGQDAMEALRLAEGRYGAKIEGGAIVVD